MPAPKPDRLQPLRLVNASAAGEGHHLVEATGAARLVPGNISPLQGPDLFALLKALRRRWLVFALLGTFAASGAAIAAWFLLAPKYTAFAQVHVASNAPRMVFRTADAAEGGRQDFVMYLRTQAARLKSRYVLSTALKSDEVKRLPLVAEQPDPIAWLDEEIKVDVLDNSEILTLTLSGSDANAVLVLVNAVTQAYLAEIDNQERKQKSRRVAELDSICGAAKEKLRVKRETLRRHVEQLGTSDSAAMTQRQLMQLASLGELKKQHSQVRFDLLQTNGRLALMEARLKKQDKAVIPETILDDKVAADDIIKQQRLRQAKFEVIIRDYEMNAQNPNESSLQRARAHLAAAGEAILKRRAAIQTALIEDYRRKARYEAQTSLEALRDTVTVLAQQEKNLSDEVEKMNREAEKIGRTSTETELLGSEIKQDEKIMQRIADELDSLQVEMRSPNRVNLYQEAALQKANTKRQILATVAAALAVLGGVGLVIAWWEFMRRRVHSTEEVVQGLRMRVVGSVPALPSGRGLQVNRQGGHDPQHQRVLHSIHNIRAMLLREARLQGIRVLMVTSADSGEGKTTLASQLASSLAQAGRKTLLIDGDLRQPALHQLFELTLQPGFTEVLLGEVSIDSAIRPTALEGLSFLAAGEWDGEVVKALAGDGLPRMIAQLKEQFDLIVIDSHPVLETTDALMIGQHVDAALLSLLRDVSQVPRAQLAIHQLSNLGVHVLGAVVNGIHHDDRPAKGRQTMVRPAADREAV